MRSLLAQRFSRILRTLVESTSTTSSSDEEVEKMISNGSQSYRVVSSKSTDKIKYYASKDVALDIHDHKLIDALNKLFSPSMGVGIKALGGGSKLFRCKTSDGDIYRIMKSRIDDVGLVVSINNKKTENPLSKSGKFLTYADIIRYLSSNKKR